MTMNVQTLLETAAAVLPVSRDKQIYSYYTATTDSPGCETAEFCVQALTTVDQDCQSWSTCIVTIYKGIAAGLSERILGLKRISGRFQTEYGSSLKLEELIRTRGVSPDDHLLYTDLLEWRAIDAELVELFHILETM